MSKMLVVVFDDEKTAFEGSRALAELHREGSISVYAGAVVARDAAGKVSVKDEADRGPIGTALGMMTGALVGALAGPEGLVAGAAAGSIVGASSDLVNVGVGADFLDEVAEKLEPGKTALVAEIAEKWVTPVDTRMEELGGTVLRRYRAEFEDDQIAREIEATQAEWKDLKAEVREADEENKAKLQAKMEAVRAKIEAAGERARVKMKSLKKEREAKAEAIENQISEGDGRIRAQLQERAAKLEADYETRARKLNQAWENTKGTAIV